jgi:catechol 2,3-dioxygenase
MTTSSSQNADNARYTRRPPGYRLPDSTHLGRARLAVSNLARSAAFYSGIIGLAVLAQSDDGKLVQLGAHGDARVLLELEERPGVKPIGKRTRLGLYHTAFLLPSREALSSFVQHLGGRRFPFGSADHEVSEALYLTDPDGLTVEVYADRPRSSWPIEHGEIQGGVEPLRFRELPAVAPDSWQGAPAGTTLGHVHFFVGDLAQASAFYHAGLGLDHALWPLPSALFLSAGGYHHHVGTNIWAAGSPVASEEDARLLFWELALPDAAEIERAATSLTAAGFVETITATGQRAFADPWGIPVALVVAGA